MFTKTLISTFAFLAIANAIKVTSPDDDTVWGTSGSQTISWEAVSTDTESFQVVLDNQQGFLPNAPVTLIQEQSTGAANTENSASVSFPGGSWPEGTGFTINLISTARNNQAIYAQSGQFNISSSGMAGSASSSTGSSSSSTMTMMTMSTPTTMTRMSTTSTGAGTGASSANAGNASGGIPNAVSYPNHEEDETDPQSASATPANSAAGLAIPALPILGALAAFFL